MNPASTIVARFGGASEVARIAGVHRTRVYTWLRNGRVPQSHQLKFLQEAKRLGVSLTAEELIGLPALKQGAAA
jgi:DNA-binding phage protein